MKSILISFLIYSLLILTACQENLQPEQLVPPTVMEDLSLPSIDVHGVKLHAQTFGDPSHPILLVLHGGPGADFRGQLNYQTLANENLFVVFYDQRGSGLSQRLPAGSYSNVQLYIDELDGVIKHYRQNDSQPVILAGHSWGAMLATAYINQKPDKIEGLILAEPGGFTWEQTEGYISRSRQLKLFDETTNDFVYLDQFITGSDHETLDYKFGLSTAGDVTTGDIGYPPFWRYGAVCSSSSIELAMNNPAQLNFTANLSSYTTKVLFTYSELNEAYGEEHANSVAGFLPNVELVEIADCGHEIPHFGWNNFYPIVKNYLNEIL